MPSISVFGAQWGDEGKGKIIDRLADSVDCVVRYQGGANAGHTVVVGDQKYVLHLIPSGVLHEGRVNLIGGGVAVDPLKLIEEIDGLAARGVQVDGSNLRLAANAHVIFEHHKTIDQLSERWRGDGRIGTTGRGIGPCYADKAARTGLRICDLLDTEALAVRLKAVLAEKNALIERVHGEAPLDLDEQLERYATLGDRLRPFATDVGREVRAAYRAGKSVLFRRGPGRRARHRYRDVPVRDVLEHERRGHRRGRWRSSELDRSVDRNRQGLLHARRRRAVPDRALGRDRGPLARCGQ